MLEACNLEAWRSPILQVWRPGCLDPWMMMMMMVVVMMMMMMTMMMV